MSFLGEKERLHVNIARLKIKDHCFEIDIDPDLAIRYKQGENIDISSIVKVPTIFSNIQKGDVASEKLLKELFGTSDVYKVADIIIKKGHIQLTTEYRRKLIEQKKKRIIDIIHKNTVDPKTHLPHPVERIESAMEEVKARVDEFKPIEKQVDEIIKKLRTVLPIKIEKTQLNIVIPSMYAVKHYAEVHKLGNIISEKWLSNGDLNIILEIPSGIKIDVIDKINAITKGEAKIDVKEL